MKTIIIQVFDSGENFVDRYTVRINDDVYCMSPDADSPGGVNTYAGPWDDWGGVRGLKLPGIPACILRAVFKRALEVEE